MTERNGQQEKQHLTITQLSTLLDGQLSLEEREFSDAHLATCEQCQQELESLRQTKMLLRALPRPVLPRSFTLPISTQQIEISPAPVPSVTPIIPIADYRSTPRPEQTSSRSNRHRGSYYTQTALRTIGTLAAMVGLVLLLSSLIPFINGSGHQTANNGNNGTTLPATRQATPTGPILPNLRGTTVTHPHTPPRLTQPSTSSHTFLPPVLDVSTLEGRAFYGALLFILGIVGLIAGRRREPSRGP